MLPEATLCFSDSDEVFKGICSFTNDHLSLVEQVLLEPWLTAEDKFSYSPWWERITGIYFCFLFLWGNWCTQTGPFYMMWMPRNIRHVKKTWYSHAEIDKSLWKSISDLHIVTVLLACWFFAVAQGCFCEPCRMLLARGSHVGNEGWAGDEIQVLPVERRSGLFTCREESLEIV